MTDQRRRKLIEVALPLEEINAACKAYKDRKNGTIRNLHKWFASMPLPAWRALLFAALIDDPVDPSQRDELLGMIRKLVSNGADLPDDRDIQRAQARIREQFPDRLPIVFDPFCGGGSTLVEGQRLGLRTRGSDLNPIPALITRTLTDVLPKVWGQQPITGPNDDGCLLPKSGGMRTEGYQGLVQDVEHYAQTIQANAKAKLGHLYELEGGGEAVAWLWARTAKCPNPACGLETVLATSWWLSKKPGSLSWISPRISGGKVHLDIVANQRSGTAPEPPKIGRGASFACLACGGILTDDVLQDQVRAEGGLGLKLVAVLAQVGQTRSFRVPTPDEERRAQEVPRDPSVADIPLPDIPRWFSGPRFGLTTQSSLYTSRQLLALTTVADLVAETYQQVKQEGGSEEWAIAVTTLLGIGVGKLAQYGSSQARMTLAGQTMRTQAAFGRNDLPMTWDFTEVNPFGGRSGGWLQYVGISLQALGQVPHGEGTAGLADARTASAGGPALVATDPPYFDAIGYADLSDYFYVWHRRALRNVHPDLYTTIAAPRAGELTAVPAHHGNSAGRARDYFVEGFAETFRNLQGQTCDGLPLVIVYASKEQKGGTEEETRWESILSAMVEADLEITGTWPVHGTGSTRMISLGTNSVATYVVMVARPREANAEAASLGDFTRALRRELGGSLKALQGASILPVDMAQAVLGPGMSIFTRYSSVTDQNGASVGVAQAIRLINTVARELQEEQEGELDEASQFALTLWQLNGWGDSTFDTANRIARPKGTSVDDVARAGVATSRANKVALLGRSGLDRKWEPGRDTFPTAWEAVHHLIDRLVDGGGETEAASLLRLVEGAGLADSSRLLTYRLAAAAAATSRTKDEERYNALIDAWPRLHAAARSTTERLF